MGDILQKYKIQVTADTKGLLTQLNKLEDKVGDKLKDIGLTEGIRDELEKLKKEIEGMKGQLTSSFKEMNENLKIDPSGLASDFNEASTKISSDIADINVEIKKLQGSIKTIAEGDLSELGEGFNKSIKQVSDNIQILIKDFGELQKFISDVRSGAINPDALLEPKKKSSSNTKKIIKEYDDISLKVNELKKLIKDLEVQFSNKDILSMFNTKDFSELSEKQFEKLFKTVRTIKSVYAELNKLDIKKNGKEFSLESLFGKAFFDIDKVKEWDKQLAEYVEDDANKTKDGKKKAGAKTIKLNVALTDSKEAIAEKLIKEINAAIKDVQGKVDKIYIKAGLQYDTSNLTDGITAKQLEKVEGKTSEAAFKKAITFRATVDSQSMKRDINAIIDDINKEFAGINAKKIQLQFDIPDARDLKLNKNIANVQGNLDLTSKDIKLDSGNITGVINSDGLATEKTLSSILGVISGWDKEGTPEQRLKGKHDQEEEVQKQEDKYDKFFKFRKRGDVKLETGDQAETTDYIMRALSLERDRETKLAAMRKNASKIKADPSLLDKMDYYTASKTVNGKEYALYAKGNVLLKDWQKTIRETVANTDDLHKHYEDEVKWSRNRQKSLRESAAKNGVEYKKDKNGKYTGEILDKKGTVTGRKSIEDVYHRELDRTVANAKGKLQDNEEKIADLKERKQLMQDILDISDKLKESELDDNERKSLETSLAEKNKALLERTKTVKDEDQAEYDKLANELERINKKALDQKLSNKEAYEKQQIESQMEALFTNISVSPEEYAHEQLKVVDATGKSNIDQMIENFETKAKNIVSSARQELQIISDSYTNDIRTDSEYNAKLRQRNEAGETVKRLKAAVTLDGLGKENWDALTPTEKQELNDAQRIVTTVGKQLEEYRKYNEAQDELEGKRKGKERGRLTDLDGIENTKATRRFGKMLASKGGLSDEKYVSTLSDAELQEALKTTQEMNGEFANAAQRSDDEINEMAQKRLDNDVKILRDLQQAEEQIIQGMIIRNEDSRKIESHKNKRNDIIRSIEMLTDNINEDNFTGSIFDVFEAAKGTFDVNDAELLKLFNVKDLTKLRPEDTKKNFDKFVSFMKKQKAMPESFTEVLENALHSSRYLTGKSKDGTSLLEDLQSMGFDEDEIKKFTDIGNPKLADIAPDIKMASGAVETSYFEDNKKKLAVLQNAKQATLEKIQQEYNLTEEDFKKLQEISEIDKQIAEAKTAVGERRNELSKYNTVIKDDNKISISHYKFDEEGTKILDSTDAGLRDRLAIADRMSDGSNQITADELEKLMSDIKSGDKVVKSLMAKRQVLANALGSGHGTILSQLGIASSKQLGGAMGNLKFLEERLGSNTTDEDILKAREYVKAMDDSKAHMMTDQDIEATEEAIEMARLERSGYYSDYLDEIRAFIPVIKSISSSKDDYKMQMNNFDAAIRQLADIKNDPDKDFKDISQHLNNMRELFEYAFSPEQSEAIQRMADIVIDMNDIRADIVDNKKKLLLHEAASANIGNLAGKLPEFGKSIDEIKADASKKTSNEIVNSIESVLPVTDEDINFLLSFRTTHNEIEKKKKELSSVEKDLEGYDYIVSNKKGKYKFQDVFKINGEKATELDEKITGLDERKEALVSEIKSLEEQQTAQLRHFAEIMQSQGDNSLMSVFNQIDAEYNDQMAIVRDQAQHQTNTREARLEAYKKNARNAGGTWVETGKKMEGFIQAEIDRRTGKNDYAITKEERERASNSTAEDLDNFIAEVSKLLTDQDAFKDKSAEYIEGAKSAINNTIAELRSMREARVKEDEQSMPPLTRAEIEKQFQAQIDEQKKIEANAQKRIDELTRTATESEPAGDYIAQKELIKPKQAILDAEQKQKDINATIDKIKKRRKGLDDAEEKLKQIQDSYDEISNSSLEEYRTVFANGEGNAKISFSDADAQKNKDQALNATKLELEKQQKAVDKLKGANQIIFDLKRVEEINETVDGVKERLNKSQVEYIRGIIESSKAYLATLQKEIGDKSLERFDLFSKPLSEFEDAKSGLTPIENRTKQAKKIEKEIQPIFKLMNELQGIIDTFNNVFKSVKDEKPDEALEAFQKSLSEKIDKYDHTGKEIDARKKIQNRINEIKQSSENAQKEIEEVNTLIKETENKALSEFKGLTDEERQSDKDSELSGLKRRLEAISENQNMFEVGKLKEIVKLSRDVSYGLTRDQIPYLEEIKESWDDFQKEIIAEKGRLNHLAFNFDNSEEALAEIFISKDTLVDSDKMLRKYGSNGQSLANMLRAYSIKRSNEAYESLVDFAENTKDEDFLNMVADFGDVYNLEKGGSLSGEYQKFVDSFNQISNYVKLKRDQINSNLQEIRELDFLFDRFSDIATMNGVGNIYTDDDKGTHFVTADKLLKTLTREKGETAQDILNTVLDFTNNGGKIESLNKPIYDAIKKIFDDDIQGDKALADQLEAQLKEAQKQKAAAQSELQSIQQDMQIALLANGIYDDKSKLSKDLYRKGFEEKRQEYRDKYKGKGYSDEDLYNIYAYEENRKKIIKETNKQHHFNEGSGKFKKPDSRGVSKTSNKQQEFNENSSEYKQAEITIKYLQKLGTKLEAALPKGYETTEKHGNNNIDLSDKAVKKRVQQENDIRDAVLETEKVQEKARKENRFFEGMNDAQKEAAKALQKTNTELNVQRGLYKSNSTSSKKMTSKQYVALKKENDANKRAAESLGLTINKRGYAELPKDGGVSGYAQEGTLQKVVGILQSIAGTISGKLSGIKGGSGAKGKNDNSSTSSTSEKKSTKNKKNKNKYTGDLDFNDLKAVNERNQAYTDKLHSESKKVNKKYWRKQYNQLHTDAKKKGLDFVNGQFVKKSAPADKEAIKKNVTKAKKNVAPRKIDYTSAKSINAWNDWYAEKQKEATTKTQKALYKSMQDNLARNAAKNGFELSGLTGQFVKIASEADNAATSVGELGREIEKTASISVPDKTTKSTGLYKNLNGAPELKRGHLDSVSNYYEWMKGQMESASTEEAKAYMQAVMDDFVQDMKKDGFKFKDGNFSTTGKKKIRAGASPSTSAKEIKSSIANDPILKNLNDAYNAILKDIQSTSTTDPAYQQKLSEVNSFVNDIKAKGFKFDTSGFILRDENYKGTELFNGDNYLEYLNGFYKDMIKLLNDNPTSIHRQSLIDGFLQDIYSKGFEIDKTSGFIVRKNESKESDTSNLSMEAPTSKNVPATTAINQVGEAADEASTKVDNLNSKIKTSAIYEDIGGPELDKGYLPSVDEYYNWMKKMLGNSTMPEIQDYWNTLIKSFLADMKSSGLKLGEDGKFAKMSQSDLAKARQSTSDTTTKATKKPSANSKFKKMREQKPDLDMGDVDSVNAMLDYYKRRKDSAQSGNRSYWSDKISNLVNDGKNKGYNFDAVTGKFEKVTTSADSASEGLDKVASSADKAAKKTDDSKSGNGGSGGGKGKKPTPANNTPKAKDVGNYNPNGRKKYLDAIRERQNKNTGLGAVAYRVNEFETQTETERKIKSATLKDANGNPLEMVETVTTLTLNYKKLEKAILDTDTAILKLNNDLDSAPKGQDKSGIQEQLDIQENNKRILEGLRDKYKNDSQYAAEFINLANLRKQNEDKINADIKAKNQAKSYKDNEAAYKRKDSYTNSINQNLLNAQSKIHDMSYGKFDFFGSQKLDIYIAKIKSSMDKLRSEPLFEKDQGTIDFLDKVESELNQIQGQADKFRGNNFLGNAMLNGAERFVDYYMDFNDFIQYIRTGIDTLKEFDTALTTISYTMDISKEGLSELGDGIIEMANNLGTSLEDASAVAEIYANMNTTVEDIQRMSTPTLVLSNLTGEDSSTAADQIQSVIEQFDKTSADAEHIVDVYDYVSKHVAIDYAAGIEGMASAVENAGASAEMAGLSYEQLSAIVAKVMEQTRQDGGQVGNALKTIFTRLSKASSMDDEVDNETLSKASAALNEIGIQVYEANGQYRQFDNIITDLSKKWDTLTDAQQANIAFQIAATRQTNVLKAILGSWTESMDLAADATTTSGNAMENQEKYMDSYNGKLQQLATAGQTFWINFLNTDLTKGIIDSITAIIKGVTELSATIGSLGTALVTLTGVGIMKNLTKIVGAFTDKGPAMAISGFVSSLGTTATVLGGILVAIGTIYGIVKLIDGAIVTSTEKIEAGQKASEEITNTLSEQKDKRDKADNLSKRYAELSKGIGDNGENATLTTEEYQEYLSVCNQIGEMCPQLVSGFDDQGNAILNLGTNAETVTNYLNDLLEADRALANMELGDDIDTVITGAKTQIQEYEDEIIKLKEDIFASESRLDPEGSGTSFINSLLYDSDGKPRTDSTRIIDKTFDTSIESQKKLLDQITKFANDTDGITPYFSNGNNENETTISLVWEYDPNSESDVKTSIENFINGLGNYASNHKTDDFEELALQNNDAKKILLKQNEQKQVWQDTMSQISDFIGTNANFNLPGMTENIQNGISNAIKDVKLTDVEGLTDNEIYNWVEEKYLNPISFAFMSDDLSYAQNAFSKLFSIDTSKLDLSEYKKSLDSVLPIIKNYYKDVYNDEDGSMFQDFLIRFNFQYAADDGKPVDTVEGALQDIKTKIGEENTSKFGDQLDNLTVDQIIALKAKVDDKSFAVDAKNAVQNAINEVTNATQKEADKASKTFASRLLDSDGEETSFSKSVDEYQSKISSITDTLSSLKTGEYKESDLTDLIQEFPELATETDNLNSALGDLQIDKFTELSKAAKEASAGITDQKEIDAMNKFMSNLGKQIDFSQVSKEKIQGQLYNNFVGSKNERTEDKRSDILSGILDKYSSLATTEIGKEVLFNVSTKINYDTTANEVEEAIQSEYKSVAQSFTLDNLLKDDDYQNMISEFETDMSALVTARDSFQDGKLDASSFKALLDAIPELSDDTDDLEKSVSNMMDSMKDNTLKYFNDRIQALKNIGLTDEANGLQRYVDSLMESVDQAEQAAFRLGQIEIKTPEYNEYEKATQTPNKGDRYNSLLSAYKTAKEAYEKGEVGTDDFKTFASMISPTGSDDSANFKENMSKFEKYFTEDGSGIRAFLQDLSQLQDAEGNAYAKLEDGEWSYTLGHSVAEMKDVAHQMGIGYEELTAILGRAEDYGGYNDFFTTREEGAQHLNDLYSQLADEQIRLAQIEADPTTADYETAKQASLEKIAQLNERILQTKQDIGTVENLNSRYTKEENEQNRQIIDSLKKQVKEMEEKGDYQGAMTLQKRISGFEQKTLSYSKQDGSTGSATETVDNYNEQQAEVGGHQINYNVTLTGEETTSEKLDVLEQKREELNGEKATLEADVEVEHTDELSALDTIINEYDNQIVTTKVDLELENGSTIEELSKLDATDIVTEWHVSMDEAQAAVDYIEQLNQPAEADFTVKIDEGQLNQILTKDDGEKEVTVVAKTEAAKKKLDEINNYEIKNKPFLVNVFGNAKKVLGDIITLRNSIQDKTVNITVNKRVNASGGGEGTVYNGTANYLGTAHSEGTALLNDWRARKGTSAYANGTDWSLPKDEVALVNEVGTESMV